jgi:hypothetical protein
MTAAEILKVAQFDVVPERDMVSLFTLSNFTHDNGDGLGAGDLEGAADVKAKQALQEALVYKSSERSTSVTAQVSTVTSSYQFRFQGLDCKLVASLTDRNTVATLSGGKNMVCHGKYTLPTKGCTYVELCMTKIQGPTGIVHNVGFGFGHSTITKEKFYWTPKGSILGIHEKFFVDCLVTTESKIALMCYKQGDVLGIGVNPHKRMLVFCKNGAIVGRKVLKNNVKVSVFHSYCQQSVKMHPVIVKTQGSDPANHSIITAHVKPFLRPANLWHVDEMSAAKLLTQQK